MTSVSMNDCSTSLVQGCTEEMSTSLLSKQEKVMPPSNDSLKCPRKVPEVIFSSQCSWLQLIKSMTWPSFQRSFRWTCTRSKILSSYFQNNGLPWGSSCLVKSAKNNNAPSILEFCPQSLILSMFRCTRLRLQPTEKNCQLRGEPNKLQAPGFEGQWRGGGGSVQMGMVSRRKTYWF